MEQINRLNSHTEEWNHIYPFIEWLHNHRMCIAKWHDPKAEYENTFTGEVSTIEEAAPWLLENPYRVDQSIENILYEYFGVDPQKLELERRKVLEEFRNNA